MRLSALIRACCVAAVGWALLSSPAWADDPVNGKALYASDCAGCHGASPLTSNRSRIYNARNARGVIDSAIGGVGDMRHLRGAYPAGSSAIADLAAYLGNTPVELKFPATAVDASAAPQSITVYASLKSGQSISGFTVAVSGDFERTGGNCGTAVATGTSCSVQIGFTPTAAGTRSGVLSLSHNHTLTPIKIALSGTGTAVTTAPVASIAPLALSFPSTAIGSTASAQNVTVHNTGNAVLAISAMAIGSPSDFIIAGGTCSAGGNVAAGASCTVSVTFKPAAGATGPRTGSLSISHNAAGSPGRISLGGSATAAPAPVASLSPALVFGSVTVGATSGVQSATLSNSGSATLRLSTLSTGSSEFSITGGSCAAGGSVPAGGQCNIQLAFKPASTGARNATLVVGHNAADGQSRASLSGTGVAQTPAIAVSPKTLSYSQVVGTTSTAQTVTVSNTGTAKLVIGTLALSGAQAAEFQISAGSTCVAGATIAPSSSCVLKLAYAPSAAGAHSASVQIGHNAAGSPASVVLNGSASLAPQPMIALNATALKFGPTTLGSTSAVQTVTLSNNGAADLVFSALRLTGTAAADFKRSGSCSANGTLTPGSTCSIGYSFTPAATGTRSATLTVVSNAGNGDAVLSLSGTGAALPVPAVELAPGTLAFGNQPIGVVSTARTVTLRNTGSGPLALAKVQASAAFSASHNCAAVVAAGASCTLSVTFAPVALGSTSGTLTVMSDAAGSPHTVTLGGTGVAASAVLAWTPATTKLDFGDQAVGAAPARRSLSLRNQGTVAATLLQFTLAGLHASDFAVGAGSGCAVGMKLAAGAGCTLDLTFQPGAVGARTASLQLSSSGSNPPDVGLTGNGAALAVPALSVSPEALTFGKSDDDDDDNDDDADDKAQTLTLHSTGNSVLRVTALHVASGAFTLEAAAADACPAPPFDLMPDQSCAVSVAWSDPAAATGSGAIAIASNAAASDLQVALTATREVDAVPSLDDPAGSGGGCSLARGDRAADPVLWLLVVLAAAVLLWRRGQS